MHTKPNTINGVRLQNGEMILTEPREKKSGIKKIICGKCHEEINQDKINSAFKVTIGLIMKRDFIPAEKSVYFHQECL